MATNGATDRATLAAELADLEAKEAQLGVRTAVVKALLACGAEPPDGEADFGAWSSCLWQELHPAPATEAGAEPVEADAA
jgi:hypothetical protein